MSQISENLLQYINNTFTNIDTFQYSTGTKYVMFYHQGQRYTLSRPSAYIITKKQKIPNSNDTYIYVGESDDKVIDILVSIKSNHIIAPNKRAGVLEKMLSEAYITKV